MQRIISVALFLLLSLIVGSCASSPTLTTERSVDRIMAAYTDENGPGASVLVMRHDSIVFTRSYGLASLAEHRAVTPATNFRLASMTKQFTAAAVLKLSSEGKLNLSDKILKFFPDFPLYGKEITVRNLLNHTSGLVDYEDFVPDTQQYQVFDADCLRLMFTADSLYFPVGTKYRYSNTGYALLALIVEKVSGKRYADYVKENLFVPAGMNTTVAYEKGISEVAQRAYGHSRTAAGWTETDQSNTSAVLGDGGIYSNVEEYARWATALWQFRILPEPLQRAAWADAALNDGTPIDYGMGWHTESFHGLRHPHHGGSTRGFRNHVLLFPDQHSLVVILTNRNEGDPITEAKAVADLFLTIP